MPAILFASPADFFDVLFGPAQHDAHVARRNGYLWLTKRTAAAQASNEAVDAIVAEIAEGEARRLSEAHGFDTAALRYEHHRWSAGCFSREPFAKTRARQLLRALDIAIERHDALQAAE